ncbi:hypothetical protein RvY_12058 [Ramazzottius varieornatus]|uniref:Uncharacterized protein n=1 Tax=Ramazzottius varieornatus TaxID=947166 RepID=A0A1D1VNL1_RAMVA|nr:hypothetical protein RvY_12058 [Ramazzottius varieornatus]
MPGQIMMQFRIVDVDLKNLCAAVTSIAVAAFGWLPGPIFMGSIVDSTCRLWRQLACGEHGACLLYDTDQFRWKFFVTAASLKVLMGLLDSVVVWRVWRLSFDRGHPSTKEPLQLELSTRQSSTAELVETNK